MALRVSALCAAKWATFKEALCSSHEHACF